MPERVRFYLDEHQSRTLQTELQRHGIDVVRAPEIRMRGASDEAHLIRAKREGRVIVTFDEDFTRLHRSHQPHAGIAFFPSRRTIGHLVQMLVLLWEVYDADAMTNRLEYL